MRKIRTFFVAVGLALLAAGGAYAATRDRHSVDVTLADGSVAHVEYVGNVAPRVRVVPAVDIALPAAEPAMFADMDRVFAEMNARNEAMMRQAALMQQVMLRQARMPGAPVATTAAPAAAGQNDTVRTVLPGGMVVLTSGGAPANVSYHFVSITRGANGCAQRVEYRSNAAGAPPQVVRTSAGDCQAAKPSAPQATAAPARHAQPQPGLPV